MSCCNSRNECDKGDKCCAKCHNNYKTIECFECECRKLDICGHKRFGDFKDEKQMGDYEA